MLSLGEFGEQELTPETRQGLLPKLRETYRTASDPGLHAATEWLMRQWQQEDWLTQINQEWARDQRRRDKLLETIKELIRQDGAKAPPQWYVNGQGLTMVVIPGPVEFRMGSPEAEKGHTNMEVQHGVRIGRAFALATKAVTVEQYRRFNARYGIGEIEAWAPTPDCPVIGTDWYQAAAYCNWLSQQEGMPESEWCYEPYADPKALPVLAGSSAGLLGSPWGPLAAACSLYPGRTEPRYAAGMKLATDYLKRSGYRLPTEAEMEYATRAGAVTSRYFGETEDLLGNYAWYQKNAQSRTWPVGGKKPNDLGFFDVQGNVFTWCQETFKGYPLAKAGETIEDLEDNFIISIEEGRVLRGGAFDLNAVIVRSARRGHNVPGDCYDNLGFRPARSFIP